MMREIEFATGMLHVDVDATRAAYQHVPGGDADRCECLNCRNYAAVRPQVFPLAARQALEALGVDPDKEAGVLDIGPLPGGRTRVIGTLHAVGQLVPDHRAAPEAVPVPSLTAELAPGFILSVAEGDWEAPMPFYGHPLLLISFEAEVPWVLPEPHPEAAAAPPAG